jgi:hypothetical protein
MPEDKHEHEGMSSTVKWLIGGVAAGLMAIGAFVGTWMKESSARQDKNLEYVQQEVDKQRSERVDFAKAFHSVADSQTKLAGAIDRQTELLGRKFDVLIADTKKFPAVREADAAPRPEQP